MNGALEAWHTLSTDEAFIRLGSAANGLSAEEAAKRLAANGPNVLPESKRRPISAVVLRQFASPLIYILFIAAAVAFIVGKTNDAIVILIVVILNALIGAFQEGRAERSMESLRKLASLHARVLRGGAELSVEARELVPGDVLLLAAGDAVGADARLLEAAALEVAEAALTGESLPVAKHPDALPEDTPLAERANMLFSGTHIAAGRGRAVVVATALDTEVGKNRDAHRRRGRAEDAAGIAHRAVRTLARSRGGGALRHYPRVRALARTRLHGNPHGRDQPDGLDGAGGFARGDDHRARRRDAAHGRARGDRAAARGGGDARLDHRDLQRQNRHAHAQRNDRDRRVAARRAHARSRRRGLFSRGKNARR